MKDKDFYFAKTSKLLKGYNSINEKQSKYNSNIFLNKCEICKSKNKLETINKNKNIFFLLIIMIKKKIYDF